MPKEGGTLKGNNWGKPRWARGKEPREGMPGEHIPPEGSGKRRYQREMSQGGIGVYQKGNAVGKPRLAWGCFVLKIKPV